MKTMLAKWLVFAGLALAALTMAGEGRADDAYLQQVDAEVNKWKTLDYYYKIVTTKKDDDEKSVLKIRMRMKYSGEYNKQLVEIGKPADMKGTKVLTISPTEMYIYLPAYGKIRRIASHVTEQGFLGTALSQRDMTLTRYADKYAATTVSNSDGKRVLSLTAKSDEAPYPKLELTVDTDKKLPVAVKYFNDEGKHIKSEKRKDYKCDKGYCVPLAMKVTDHTTGVTSILYLKKHKVNPKLDADLFSKRVLK